MKQARFTADFSRDLTRGTAVSDVDGRYRRITKQLANYFSEAGLQRYRAAVEVNYLFHLSNNDIIRPIKRGERIHLKDMVERFTLRDFTTIKKYEKTTNHDVKAVEYYVKRNLPASMSDVKEMVHFALTSEDVSNTAYSLALKDSTEDVLLPAAVDVLEKLTDFAVCYRDIPMLARTHGQPASPTTVGKEFANFAYRLNEGVKKMAIFKFPGKMSGATGNFNAHVAAKPDIDWQEFARSFVENRMGLCYVPCTSQILPHDEISAFLYQYKDMNRILEGFAQDCWRYISDDWFKLKVNEKETGSSTMAHKVNPIDFENAEGNMQTANALLGSLADKLQVSRLQRDLSGSTVQRKYGTALAYTLVGWRSLSRGMDKIEPNRKVIARALSDHAEVLSEPIQTILRTAGYSKPYEQLKELTRGKEVSMTDITNFIYKLDVSEDVRQGLLGLKLETYIGLAPEITAQIVTDCRETIRYIRHR